ncbi:MAG: hypothetical protein J3K34DRAFT_122752 [Monoraphidium minutum]|nr:MAG: hypothetical protein J3K34DRAFT_122752 [Monoraphidium minutum]
MGVRIGGSRALSGRRAGAALAAAGHGRPARGMRTVRGGLSPAAVARPSRARRTHGCIHERTRTPAYAGRAPWRAEPAPGPWPPPLPATRPCTLLGTVGHTPLVAPIVKSLSAAMFCQACASVHVALIMVLVAMQRTKTKTGPSPCTPAHWDASLQLVNSQGGGPGCHSRARHVYNSTRLARGRNASEFTGSFLVR